MSWMQFATGILVANKYILDYSVFNLFLIQHIYLTTVLCISFTQTIPKIFPCPHSLLASTFTDTALVQVPDFLKQTQKDCLQLDLFTFLKIFFFNFWDISPNCPHFSSLFSEFSFSAQPSNLTSSRERLTSAPSFATLSTELSAHVLRWSTSGLSRRPEMGHREHWNSFMTAIPHSWMDKWSRVVSEKQDQGMCLDFGFVRIYAWKDPLYVTRKKEPA